MHMHGGGGSVNFTSIGKQGEIISYINKLENGPFMSHTQNMYLLWEQGNMKN